MSKRMEVKGGGSFLCQQVSEFQTRGREVSPWVKMIALQMAGPACQDPRMETNRRAMWVGLINCGRLVGVIGQSK